MARTLVTIIFMLICLVMIIVVMMQESKNSGFGALSGQVDSDSYVRKNRGRTKEGKLERITAILGFLFFVVAIGLCLKVFQYGAKAGKPYNLSDFKVKPVGELDYQVGDRVKHIKFGVGTVQEITKGGRDFEVAVEFDRVGRKKMFASFAKLKKVK